MSERKVVHEIKLERSVKVAIVVGPVLLGLQVFGPALSIKGAV